MGRVYRADRDRPDSEMVRLAHAVLSEGGVVVLPTETVYGLALDPFSCETPQQLFDIKRRDRDLTIPWLVADEASLGIFGRDVPDYAYRLAARFWPGPLTLVVKATARVPSAYRSADGTIALRVPDLGIVQALLGVCDGPLCVTSANTHGHPAPGGFEELEPRIVEAAALTLDGGPTPVGRASTIVSCLDDEPVILRESALSAERILEGMR